MQLKAWQVANFAENQLTSMTVKVLVIAKFAMFDLKLYIVKIHHTWCST